MPLRWDAIRLVVFDMDGTLYRQRPMRLRMARDILFHTLAKRDVTVATVLARYRRIRERMGDGQGAAFEQALIDETAEATANSSDRVCAIVSEWIERRPLDYILACRYPGVPQLFAGLRRNGKAIGILSDYPARMKLAALGLAADHVVSAGDDGIESLKPHPKGLQALIASAGVAPSDVLVIGDRTDRDGLVARNVGAQALIRSSRPIDGWQTFARFDDAVFAPVLAS